MAKERDQADMDTRQADHIIKPFVAMATATAHLDRKQTLIVRPARDNEGNIGFREITVGDLFDLVKLLKELRG